MARPELDQDRATRERRQGHLRVAACLGVLLGLAVTLGLLLAPWSRRGGANSLDPLLRLASFEAARAPSRLPTAFRPYAFRDSESGDLLTLGSRSGPWSALVKTHREEWVRSDGSGRLRERSGAATFLGPRDRVRWREAGSPRLGSRLVDERIGPGSLGDRDLLTWSTHPTRLRAQLRARASRSDAPVNEEMLVLVGDLLRQTAAPAGLRAALYRVASTIPGVDVIRHVVDPAGRPGAALAITSAHSGNRERYALIFDARTSNVLAEVTELLQEMPYVDANAPVVTEYRVFLRDRSVASLSGCPAGLRC